MDEAGFDAIVREAELLERQRPVAYRRRVVALALLGYCYIALVLVALLVALGLLGLAAIRLHTAILLKFLIAILVLVGLVLRALWVRLPAPGGVVLHEDRVPRLFELLRDVIARTGAPPVSTVVLTRDLNAAIVQRPRFGPLFGYRNYLVLGLPLLETLPLEEVRAVVAHECGHLSGSHGKVTAWVYRLRTTWSTLAGGLKNSGHWGRWLFVPFFNWYAPRFAAYSFVMARSHEYAADAVSASVTNAAVSGAALVRVSFAARWLHEDFWPSLLRKTEASPEPNVAPMHLLAGAGTARAIGGAPAEWLVDALAETTGTADTHPSLADRLHALGVAGAPPTPCAESAAEALLGADREALAAAFDDFWRKDNIERWRQEHEARVQQRARREELEQRSQSGPLPAAEQYELAMLYSRNDEVARAIALLRALVATNAEHADAHANLGAMLADRRDAGAIEHLELAIQLDPAWTQAAGQILQRELRRAGRGADMERLREQMRAHRKGQAAIAAEAEQIRPTHGYEALTIEPEARASIAAVLRQERSDVRRAWLLGRSLGASAPTIPLLVVERRSPWWRLESSERSSKLLARLVETVPLPPGSQLIVTDNRTKWLLRKARRLSASQVYPAAAAR